MIKIIEHCVLGLLILGLIACSSGSSRAVSVGNGMRKLSITADLSNVKALATTSKNRPAPSLMKIDTKELVSELLSNYLEARIDYWQQTPTHLIVQGEFRERDALYWCNLLAIEKKSEKQQVLCLGQHSGEEVGYTAHSFDTAGSRVVFRADSDGTEIRLWDGKSNTAQTLYHLNKESAAPFPWDIFLSESRGNVCFDDRQKVYCRDSQSKVWNVVEDLKLYEGPSQSYGYAFFPLIKYRGSLLSLDRKLNLDSMEVAKREGPVANSRDTYPASNDGAVGQFGLSLVYLDRDGNGKTLGNYSINIARNNDYLWYWSGKALTRISLTNLSIDPNDYSKNTKLKWLGNYFWTAKNLLQIYGTNEFGMPAISFLDKDGNFVDLKEEQIPLENPVPITLNP